jgi:hypothetical protein
VSYLLIAFSMLTVNIGMFARSHSAIGLTPATAQTATTAGTCVVNFFYIRQFRMAKARVPTIRAVI